MQRDSQFFKHFKHAHNQRNDYECNETSHRLIGQNSENDRTGIDMRGTIAHSACGNRYYFQTTLVYKV